MEEKTHARIVYDACKELDFKVRSYSGRGMYGKKCLAFTTPSVLSDLTHLSALLARQESLTPHEHHELFENGLKTGSMEKEQIAYFPGLKWEDIGVEEDE